MFGVISHGIIDSYVLLRSCEPLSRERFSLTFTTRSSPAVSGSGRGWIMLSKQARFSTRRRKMRSWHSCSINSRARQATLNTSLASSSRKPSGESHSALRASTRYKRFDSHHLS